MRTEDESMRTLEAVLKLASQGMDAAEVSLSGGKIGLTRFADDEVHQAAELSRESIGIRVQSEGRLARIEIGDFSLEAVQSAVRQVKQMVQYMPHPDTPTELPGPQKYLPTEAFDPETEKVGALDRMAVVGRVLKSAAQKGVKASGYLVTASGTLDDGADGDAPFAIANSKGLVAYHPCTRATLSITMQGPDGSGWAEGSGFSASMVDADTIANVATQKALGQKRLRSIGPGRYTVVLEPAAVASLFEFLAAGCGAEDVERGSSFMSGRAGEKVADESVTIHDDHGHELHRGVPFDVEGVARRRVTLIENGVIRDPVIGLASAARLKVDATGHQVRSALFGEVERPQHLVMAGGEGSLGRIIESTTNGVLVSRLWYVRLLDPRTLTLTGMTRDGTFLIEQGRVTTAVRNLRFNVSLLDMLSNVEALGRPTLSCGMVVPPLKVRGFAFTSGEGA